MTLETQGGGSPGVPGATPPLVERVKNILLQPKAEWQRIDAEPATVAGIFKNYVLILAAIPPVASLIGMQLFGFSMFGVTYRPSLASGIVTAVLTYGLSLVSVFLISLIIDALAPTFNGTKNQVQATKVAAYSYTASWVAGIFGLIPQLAVLAIIGGLYGLYLLYLGLPRLMKTPEDKAVPYTGAVIVAAILVSLVAGVIVGALAAVATPRPPLGEISGTANVPGLGAVDMGKMEQAAARMEETAKRLQEGQAQPAVAPAALQALLPEALGAYRRVEVSSSGASAGGVGGSSAEARYQNGDSRIELRVSDIAAAGAIAALGSAFNVEASRQTESGYERTGQVDGRMTNEKWDNQARRGEYGVLVADRFMVEASGNVASVEILKQAVNAVGLSRVEALKS